MAATITWTKKIPEKGLEIPPVKKIIYDKIIESIINCINIKKGEFFRNLIVTKKCDKVVMIDEKSNKIKIIKKGSWILRIKKEKIKNINIENIKTLRKIRIKFKLFFSKFIYSKPN